LDSFGPLKDLIEKGKKGGQPNFSLNEVFSFLFLADFIKLFQKTIQNQTIGLFVSKGLNNWTLLDP